MKKHSRGARQESNKNGGAGVERHASLRAVAGDAGGAPVRIGIVENFSPGDRAGVDAVLTQIRALGIADVRTTVSWADWETPEDEAWYRWLLPRLASQVNVIPCVLYTPPSQAVAPRLSAAVAAVSARLM